MLDKLGVLLYIFLIFVGCNKEQKIEIVEFGGMNIPVEKDWEISRPLCIDVQCMLIQTEKGDSIEFIDDQYTTESFEDYVDAYLDTEENKGWFNQDYIRQGIYSVVRNENDLKQAVHLDYSYYYDTIGGYVGKVMLPKRFDKMKEKAYGIVIYDIGKEKNKLTIYSTSNNKYMEEEVLNLIENMKKYNKK